MATIALLGSGEFEPWARAVDAWAVGGEAGAGSRVIVVPAASAPEGAETFERWAQMGLEHYRAMGLSPEVLPLKTREDALEERIAAQIAGARLIFFSGGNPGYLAEILRDTPVWSAIADALASGTAFGGCSAGAAFAGSRAPYVEGDTLSRWVDGVGVLPRGYFMPHFDMLESYMPGLRELVMGATPPGSTPVGLDENTAMCGDGTTWVVHGTGSIRVGHDLTPYQAGDTFTLDLL